MKETQNDRKVRFISHLPKAFILIGPCIFLLLLLSIDTQTIVKDLLKIELGTIALLLPLVLTDLLIRSLKWRIIVNSLHYHISVLFTVRLSLIGIYTGLITPGRVGELAKVIYLEAKGIPKLEGASSVMIDRTIDVLVLLALSSGSMAAFTFLGFGSMISGVILVLVPAVTLILLILIMYKTGIPSWLARQLPIVSEVRLRLLSLKIQSIGTRSFVLATFAGVAVWIVIGLEGMVVASGLGISLSVGFWILAMPLVTIAEILPISVWGLGTRDLIVVYLFSFASIRMELAIVFSLAYFTLTYLIPGLFGMVFSFFYPMTEKNGLG